jgi:hypothetical protein
MGIDGLNNDDSADDRGSSSADGFDGTAEQHGARKPDDGPLQEERRSREELYADLRAEAGAEVSEEAGSGRPRDRTDEQREFVPNPDEPRNTGDGGWEWKGLRLDPEANRIADSAISARRAAEGRDIDGSYGDHGITRAMRRIEAQLEHGSLVPDTEKFALKSPDRFKEKLAKMIERRPDASVYELAHEIHDGIRYTLLFDVHHYTDGTKDACKQLIDHRYELVRLANRWDGEEYKGINSRWHDLATGQQFEVQFHTPDSWDAKQKTHDTYEKIDSPVTPVEEVEQLRTYQRQISGSIPLPDGWKEITDYRKPGS